MFVKEFGKQLNSVALNKELSSVYGWSLKLNEMQSPTAQNILSSMGKRIKTIKMSPAAHVAEKNPQYMEALLVSKVLETWMNEREVLLSEQNKARSQILEYVSILKKPLSESEKKKAAALAAEFRAKGLVEHFRKKYGKKLGEEICRATVRRMVKNETRELPKQATLLEGELDQARAVMGARGIVDEIQKIVEKVSSLSNEEIIALADIMRSDVGADKASRFNSEASQALDALLSAAKTAREALDSAARAVAGEEPALPASGDDLGGMDDMGGMGDLGGAPKQPAPEFDTSDAATGGDEELGRSLRI